MLRPRMTDNAARKYAALGNIEELQGKPCGSGL